MIIPINEGLLQLAAVDPLLGRLQSRWPERAQELIDAYHDVRLGRRSDEIFSSAFKSLEEIARSIARNPHFDFVPADMARYFPNIHITILQTIYKLRAHRGDAASHGRKSPTLAELQYLLVQICNVALLLFEHEAEPALG